MHVSVICLQKAIPVVRMAPLSPMTENETVKKSCCIAATVMTPTTNNSTSPGATMPATAPPTKRTPNDFIFGKVIGEGSFSTVR